MWQGLMECRGFHATVTYDPKADVFRGQTIDTREPVTFHGESVDELQAGFQSAIDAYLELCAERNLEPDKRFSGRIPLRVTPDVHRAATEAAKAAGMSLNAWITEQLEQAARETLG